MLYNNVTSKDPHRTALMGITLVGGAYDGWRYQYAEDGKADVPTHIGVVKQGGTIYMDEDFNITIVRAKEAHLHLYRLACFVGSMDWLVYVFQNVTLDR